MRFLTTVSVPRSNDTWGLGCLMFEVFNGQLMKRNALKSTAKVGGRVVNMAGSG